MGKIFMPQRIRSLESGKFDEHTLLLLDGNSIKDKSMYKVPITNQGVIISTDQGGLGQQGLYFNKNSFLKLGPINVNFNFDFTLDWWEWRGEGNIGPVFSMDNHKAGFIVADSGYSFRLFGGDTRWNWIPATHVGTVIANQWNHIACIRFNDIVMVYVNGKKTKEVKPNGSLTMTENFYVGYRAEGTENYLGYISNFRISDIARWTSDFIPPIRPY